MATEIKIPIPDQTTEEVRIVKWMKAPGEAVANGEVVLEVETDKSVIEVESVGEGVLLEQLHAENDMVPVGKVVGFVGAAGEKVSSSAKSAGAAATAVGSKSQTAESAGSPSVVTAASAVPAGVSEVKVPIPDQTTEEVRVVKWLKSVGDAVVKSEVVLEVETDKSVIEVESVGEGVLLKQLHVENDMVPVGKVVGFVGPSGTKIGDAAGQASGISGMASSTVSAAAAPAAVSTDAGGRIMASPVAKNLAAKLGVDLRQVTGSGPNGRIIKADVETIAASGSSTGSTGIAVMGTETVQAVLLDGGRVMASPRARKLASESGVDLRLVKGTGAGGRIVGDDVQNFAGATGKAVTAEAVAAGPAPDQPQPGTEVVVTKMRRAIGMNLQMSSRDVPHFNVTMSVDMKRAMAFRKEINQGRENGTKISVNDLVIKAVANALTHYPAVNSRFTGEKIIYLPDINVGVATAVKEGLVVPVLTNAEKRSWEELAVETKRLALEARTGKIIGAGKGTFTVSNLGMFGVDNFTAIINPPESAILAVGAVKDEVVAIEGGIGIRPMMKMTLCSDHRVIDGALASEFLRSIKTFLEDEIC
ncbi:MAG: 2-oxo acid dehydrogenase subunit E2 [Sedimentisphaerales bacterium]|nr:2-oxo acid dehydrogenase subunit E2 [Sedimentisphaerales bacterium]